MGRAGSARGSGHLARNVGGQAGAELRVEANTRFDFSPRRPRQFREARREQQAQFEVSHGGIRSKNERLAKLVLRLLFLSCFGQGGSEARVGCRQPRFERNGSLVLLDRTLEVTGGHQRVAEVIAGFGEIRLDAGTGGELLCGLLLIVLLPKDSPQIVMRFGVVGVLGERAAEGRGRTRQIPSVPKLKAAV